MASNFYFNLKETGIFQAVKWSRHPFFRWARCFKNLFLFLALAFSILFLVSLFSQEGFLGLALISLVLHLWFLTAESFFFLKLCQPEIKKKPQNLADFLSFSSAIAVWKAEKMAHRKNYPSINSTSLLYYLLLENKELNFVFYRALIDPKEIKKVLKENLKKHQADGFEETILKSLQRAEEKNHPRVEKGDLLEALSQTNPFFREVLVKSELKTQDIKNLVRWLEKIENVSNEEKSFFSLEKIRRKGTLAKNWCSGYTITLDRYSIDWGRVALREGFNHFFGHQNELFNLERILSRHEINNALLVGKPGSGRKNIVRALARRSFLGEGMDQINHKRVIELDLNSLVSQIDNSEELEYTLNRILEEVIYAGNIILIIDEFHNYVGGQFKPGVIDVSGMLAPFLRSPQLQIVAVTTFEGLHKNIEKNSSLIGFFEKVEVMEISEEETIEVLESRVPFFEKKYNKFISYPALRSMVYYSSKYLPAASFPKKAIDLLDEIMVDVSRQRKKKIVLTEDVARVISQKTEVPVGEIEDKERDVLLNMEELIHKRIVNQEEAVKEIASALRRSRVGTEDRKKPMGSFLFLGPTGVGKTETAKALAQVYFGSESRIIRLDMSEFQDVKDIPRLICSTEQEGILTTKVKEDPFSLVLLDEIEKAHPNILNLFLQVLDEGHITDGLGRQIFFSNTLIIATSNAGAEVIWKDVRSDKKLDIIKEDLLSLLFEKGKFRPEFINRFDAVVIFKPLNKENLLEISQLMLEKIRKGMRDEKGIDFEIAPELNEKIVDLGYSPAFGAREMRRVIADRVENLLAVAFLKKEIKRGDKIKINATDFSISLEKNAK